MVELMGLVKAVLWITLVFYPAGMLMFFGYSHAKHLKEEGVKFHKWWVVVPVYIALFYFLVLDFLFNIIMSFRFKELPKWHKKEFLFTTRIQRWVNDYNDALKFNQNISKEHKRALKWAERLNKIDPGHVTL